MKNPYGGLKKVILTSPSISEHDEINFPPLSGKTEFLGQWENVFIAAVSGDSFTPADPSDAQVQFALELAAPFFSPLAWHSWCWAGICLGGWGHPEDCFNWHLCSHGPNGLFPRHRAALPGECFGCTAPVWVQPCPGCSCEVAQTWEPLLPWAEQGAPPSAPRQGNRGIFLLPSNQFAAGEIGTVSKILRVDYFSLLLTIMLL